MFLTGVEGDFPNLLTDNHIVTSQRDSAYNCIAWAAGDLSKWWWPDALNSYYWPPGATRKESVEAFIEAFEKLGYRVCSSGSLEADVEKIAIFAIMGKPTHAARQLRSGKWTSKLGREEDISHRLRALEGPLYGEATIFMSRKRGD